MRTAGGGCAGCSSCEPARGGPPVRVTWNACDLEAAASVRRGRVVVAAGAAHDVLAVGESDVAAGERRRRTLLRGLGILAVDADGGVAFGKCDGSGTGNEGSGERDLGHHDHISF